MLGIDSAPAVLDAARRNADGRDAAGRDAANVRFAVATACTLPAADASVEVVFAHQVLQHLPDPIAALARARRVLADDGYVAVRDADSGTMTHHPHGPMLDRWLDVHHTMARRNEAEPDAGRRLLGWVTEAGFTHALTTRRPGFQADPRVASGPSCRRTG